tara:strand:- start:397 stop:570 length:174 start_codon:yes stop_codon:yes gene_type:complete
VLFSLHGKENKLGTTSLPLLSEPFQLERNAIEQSPKELNFLLRSGGFFWLGYTNKPE